MSKILLPLQRAAIRKLGHELGIPEMQLSLDAFRYLTRLHYCAADTGTYGAGAPWGEHEVGNPKSGTKRHVFAERFCLHTVRVLCINVLHVCTQRQ